MIYFVSAREVGRVKIGYTTGRVMTRLAALRTGSPVHLEVMGIINGGRPAEQAWHARWRRLRWRNEWFTLAPELEAAILEALHGREAALEILAMRRKIA